MGTVTWFTVAMILVAVILVAVFCDEIVTAFMGIVEVFVYLGD